MGRSRIADESSLLIMDILIELEDGSLANLEAQKVGYMQEIERLKRELAGQNSNLRSIDFPTLQRYFRMIK